MSGNDLTADALKQKYAAVIPKSSTFEPQGISEGDARAYLDTNEGALYWYRLAEADPNVPSATIDERALEHLTSGLELPRMVTLSAHEPLLKIVPSGSSPTTYTPFWARESTIDAAVTSGKNLSEYFGLPIVSEASKYDVYRITPKLPTQVFVNTVAPTSELGGLVTKTGGAEQYLVPNRQLFTDAVYARSVDNTLSLVAEAGRSSLSPQLMRGAGALGAAALTYDATTTTSHTANLLHQHNTVGAASTIEHFGSRNLGMLGGAALGAEAFGAAGIESGPLDVIAAGVGGVVGAIGGEKLMDAVDHQKIYAQHDAQGQVWSFDPTQPQQGWTRTVNTLDAEASRLNDGFPAYKEQTERAPPALAERLTYQANATAVELALAHPATPRDPYSQPAGVHDSPSRTDAPWLRDAQTHQWSRTVTDAVLEHSLKSTHVEVATLPRAAELDRAAQATLADNVAHSPRGIAKRYQAIYAERGWSQYGAMPDAVTTALNAPAHTLQASDGHTYTHDAAGQWSTPGAFHNLLGPHAAEGNVRAELDATARLATAAPSISHSATTNKPPHPAHAPVAATPAHAIAPAASVPPPMLKHLRDFSDPTHPRYAMYCTLKELLPQGTSEARLMQGTAACYRVGITDPRTLTHIDIGDATVRFSSNVLGSPPALMDISQPAPSVQQSVHLVEQRDQQLAQMHTQFQTQQLNAQAQQGPMR